MDHPKNHSLFGLRLPGYFFIFFKGKGDGKVETMADVEIHEVIAFFAMAKNASLRKTFTKFCRGNVMFFLVVCKEHALQVVLFFPRKGCSTSKTIVFVCFSSLLFG